MADVCNGTTFLAIVLLQMQTLQTNLQNLA